MIGKLVVGGAERDRTTLAAHAAYNTMITNYCMMMYKCKTPAPFQIYHSTEHECFFDAFLLSSVQYTITLCNLLKSTLYHFNSSSIVDCEWKRPVLGCTRVLPSIFTFVLVYGLTRLKCPYNSVCLFCSGGFACFFLLPYLFRVLSALTSSAIRFFARIRSIISCRVCVSLWLCCSYSYCVRCRCADRFAIHLNFHSLPGSIEFNRNWSVVTGSTVVHWWTWSVCAHSIKDTAAVVVVVVGSWGCYFWFLCIFVFCCLFVCIRAHWAIGILCCSVFLSIHGYIRLYNVQSTCMPLHWHAYIHRLVLISTGDCFFLPISSFVMYCVR